MASQTFLYERLGLLRSPSWTSLTFRYGSFDTFVPESPEPFGTNICSGAAGVLPLALVCGPKDVHYGKPRSLELSVFRARRPPKSALRTRSPW